MTGKVLVIGYGNSLRGDDGIGPAVAQAFADEDATECADVIVCHQLTPELAESIAAVDLPCLSMPLSTSSLALSSSAKSTPPRRCHRRSLTPPTPLHC